MAEIKAAGKGDITHYPEIESEDLTKDLNKFDAALFAFTVFVGTKFCLLAMISSSE
jgi:hypothetical protein